MNNDQPSRRSFFTGLVGGLMACLGLKMQSASAAPPKMMADNFTHREEFTSTVSLYDADGNCIEQRTQFLYLLPILAPPSLLTTLSVGKRGATTRRGHPYVRRCHRRFCSKSAIAFVARCSLGLSATISRRTFWAPAKLRPSINLTSASRRVVRSEPGKRSLAAVSQEWAAVELREVELLQFCSRCCPCEPNVAPTPCEYGSDVTPMISRSCNPK